ncbi:MAG TPA: proton-conducting transporter membrane subunit [Pilimelia sp.]|nr:proton-conducting transporter membrane subunit [Pilimelia sp.]
MTAALLAAAAAPLVAFVVLAVPAWAGRPWSERAVSAVTVGAFGLAAACGAAAAAAVLGTGQPVHTPLLTWYRWGAHGGRLGLLVDGLAAPFAVLVPLVLTAVAGFSRRYLHAEPGYRRYHLLLTLFGGGAGLVVLAGTLDVTVVGWELAGLAAALLIGFFHQRPRPLAHAVRAFVVYRLCDTGLLLAAAWAHHHPGADRYAAAAGRAVAGLPAPDRALPALLVGGALLWAAVGKSALFPLGGWLPRAMEGPTPSSALCYGAVSVSLGPYLLLRTTAGWPPPPALAAATVAVGVLTAVHATVVGRVQTDAKSRLAYASMTQTGLVVAEIGLGLTALAAWHLAAHGLLRVTQFLRAPSLLHDHQHRAQLRGAQAPARRWRLVPAAVRRRWYRHALERGHLDALTADWVRDPLARLLRFGDAADRWWERRWAAPRTRPGRTDRQEPAPSPIGGPRP